MRFVSATWLAIVLLGAAPAWGAGPLAAAPVGPNAAEVETDSSAGAQKVAGIETLFSAARYDEAIDAAKAYLRAAQDDGLKAEATRLVAESLRKKGDWKRAMGAYVGLRDRFEKGSDEYVTYDAMAEILRASPSGVYQQGATGAADRATSETPRTLDADDAVREAMARLAATRAEKLKPRIAALRRARAAEDLMKAFVPLAEELRQLRVLAPGQGPDLERAAAQTAAMRMAEISGQALASLKAKQAEFKASTDARRLTAAQKRDILLCKAMCDDMAKAEDTLLAGMARMPGTADWPEGDQLRTETAERRDAFQKLAKGFVVPRSGGGKGWGDSNWLDRGGGGGMGGGGM